METLKAILPYAEITLSLLLILGIVLQQRGANLGGAFGGDNFASTFYKRRGAEKVLFNATIVIALHLAANRIAASFSGPTGSSTCLNPAGSVLRNPNRFVIMKPRNPIHLARRLQRSTVGSLTNSSAVDGFSIKKFSQPLGR